MTAAQKAKFLSAVDEIERAEGIDAALSPEAIVELLQFRYRALCAELQPVFFVDHARELVARRGGTATRHRRARCAM